MDDIEETNSQEVTGDDVEMDNGEAAENVEENDGETGNGMPFDGEEITEPRQTFLDYLMSPMVTLLIGSGETQTMLTAHQALLLKSPYLSELCKSFIEDGAVSHSTDYPGSFCSAVSPLVLTLDPTNQPRSVELPDDDITTVGCFLEFLYTGEYFPRKLPGQRTLETDPSLPSVDDTGEQLLKHARVYTLAEKFGVSQLKTLATSKIHCINSTVKGEIAYARYVYAFTEKDDTAVRAPVVSFWATRSHTLRSEAEEEFKSLCLEFPQFGYDVLSKILFPGVDALLRRMMISCRRFLWRIDEYR